MTTSTATPAAARACPPTTRLSWALALAAGLGWWMLYGLNDRVWDTVVYSWWGLAEGSRWGQAVHFFLYDTVKIALLLGGIVFVLAVARTFITLERTRAILGGPA